MKSERRIKVLVQQINRDSNELDVVSSMTGTAFKALVSAKTGINSDQIKLICKQRTIKLYHTLADFLDSEETELRVYLVRCLGHRDIRNATIYIVDQDTVATCMQGMHEGMWCCWGDLHQNDRICFTLIKNGRVTHFQNIDTIDLAWHAADMEVDINEIVEAKKPKPPVVQVFEDNVTEEIRAYVKAKIEQMKNTVMLADLQLSEAELERFERENAAYFDCVTYEIMNVPVKLVATRNNHFFYEFSTLANQPINADGTRTIPNTTLPFYLRDIVPAPEASLHIQNQLRRLQVWREPVLLAPVNQAPAAAVFRQGQLQASPSVKGVKKLGH